MQSQREKRIRQRAYEIWQREGEPQGRDAEHWRKAEVEIAAESADGPEASEPRMAEPRRRGGPARRSRAVSAAKRRDGKASGA